MTRRDWIALSAALRAAKMDTPMPVQVADVRAVELARLAADAIAGQHRACCEAVAEACVLTCPPAMNFDATRFLRDAGCEVSTTEGAKS